MFVFEIKTVKLFCVFSVLLLIILRDIYCMFFRYTPQSIELEHKLKPFIPDFIPAVGDIDAFVKVCSKGYSFKNI